MKTPLNELTTREKIIEILRSIEHPVTVDELADMLGERIDPREIYAHLEHVSKSIRARSKGREILVMEPPMCRKCGYVFQDLNKPRKPSKCPRCKSEWIAAPRFIIIRNE